MVITKDTTKAIRKWLASNDFGVGCRLAKDFYYDEFDNYIGVASNYDSTYDEWFVDTLRELGLASNYNVLTLSVLHELGHYETIDKFSEYELGRYNTRLNALMSLPANMESVARKYWRMPIEKAANEWLVWFCDNYSNAVAELEKITSPQF